MHATDWRLQHSQNDNYMLIVIMVWCLVYFAVFTLWHFGRLTIPEDMKIDLKAKLIVSLIHVGYLDCFAVRLSLQFTHTHTHTHSVVLTIIFQVCVGQASQWYFKRFPMKPLEIARDICC